MGRRPGSTVGDSESAFTRNRTPSGHPTVGTQSTHYRRSLPRPGHLGTNGGDSRESNIARPHLTSGFGGQIPGDHKSDGRFGRCYAAKAKQNPFRDKRLAICSPVEPRLSPDLRTIPPMQGSISCWNGSRWNRYEASQLVKLGLVLEQFLPAPPAPQQAWLEILADPLTLCRDGLLAFVSGGCLVGMGPLGAQSAVIREALPHLFQREKIQAALLRGGSLSQLTQPDLLPDLQWWIETESGAEPAIQSLIHQATTPVALIRSGPGGIPQQIAPAVPKRSSPQLASSPPLPAQQMEALLSTHPAIWAAVIVSAEKVGKPTVPVAYVQLRPDKTAEPREIYEFAKAHTEEQEAVPQGIRIVDVLPLAADGRFDRAKLSQAESR